MKTWIDFLIFYGIMVVMSLKDERMKGLTPTRFNRMVRLRSPTSLPKNPTAKKSKKRKGDEGLFNSGGAEEEV